MKKSFKVMALLFCLSGFVPGGETEVFAGTARREAVDRDLSSGKENSYDPAAFIRRKGQHLVVGEGDDVIRLRGVNFNNYHWLESGPGIIHSDHHAEVDFQRVAAMGMNVIRFNLNYVVFEDDSRPYVYKQEGWDWLDQNIEWAKKYGLYLILDMHVPPGGYQGGSATGLPLWTVAENQNRLKALWRAIAGRYRNELAVAGYNLINEPTPPDSVEQWSVLARGLAGEIRSVDRNHLIIVEKVLRVYYGGAHMEDPATQFLVDDDNVMYEFHFYYPSEYTHQNNEYSGTPEDGPYPDETVYYLPWNFQIVGNSSGNPSVQEGDWRYYEGVLYKVEDPAVVGGYPVFSAHQNEGAVYFGDFVIRGYNENDAVVWEKTVEITSEFGWSPWSDDGSGTFAFFTGQGPAGGACLSIAGITGEGNWANSDYLSFPVEAGYRYQISGWMKGVNISGGARCVMGFEFVHNPAGVPVYPRNRSYLEHTLRKWCAFGEANNVPMNVGEFGLMIDCFNDGKGGLTWLTDLLGLMAEAGVHFQYYDYHSEMGLYLNQAGFPDPGSAHHGVIDLFRVLFDACPPARRKADYDGDGTSEIAVFRKSTGLWALRGISRTYFGGGDDRPVPGDYNGDGTAEIGIFRARSGLWAIKDHSRFYFGAPFDMAVPGDCDGDGRTDPGIYRPSIGLWALRGVSRSYFGRSGDSPVPGDYDGDGTGEIAVYRGTTGLWTSTGLGRVYFGAYDDIPVPGDYGGDGTFEPGIYRPVSGLWAIRGISRTYFGRPSDQPVPADYDGDASGDVGIFRNDWGLWAVKGVTRRYFGRGGDTPVTR